LVSCNGQTWWVYEWKARTTSDDAGGKSLSEKSKSTGGKCVSENSTGGKNDATRTSNNPFETSRSEKPQYFVDVVKDKRTKNNKTFPCVSHTNTLELLLHLQHLHKVDGNHALIILMSAGAVRKQREKHI